MVRSKDRYSVLNPQQLAVVEYGDGPCLVLAGAGSGKTLTITYRIAYLIEEKKVNPQHILLVTFTNKAAHSMLTRLESLLGYNPKGLWGGTFHHIGNLILRKHAEKLGYNSNFNILDREDSKDLLHTCMIELNIDTKAKRFPKAEVIQEILSFARNTEKTIKETMEIKTPYFLEHLPTIESIVSYYQKKKKDLNVMDYDDLLANWRQLLLEDESVRSYYDRLFHYILVDEYQDTNRLQGEILNLLAKEIRNILVVGDDAQSIYSFRGADYGNILRFPEIYTDCKIFKIEYNYRSTPEILNLANHIIAHNKKQFSKVLRPTIASGPLPELVTLKDEREEAQFVASKILELDSKGIPLEEIGVLFRANWHSMDLQIELARRNIPYIVRGGLRFFEQAHIKDVVAFLRIVVNPKDELAALRTLKLYDGIGAKIATFIWQKAKETDFSFESLMSIEIPHISKKGKESWENFCHLYEEAILLMGEDKKPAPVLDLFFQRFYRDYLQVYYPNFIERAKDIEQLIKLATRYRNAISFINDLSLQEHFYGEDVILGATETNHVVLSTIHQAKGLEWQVVFIIHLVDGCFPDPRSVQDEDALEEERRLFYVASTRAKRELYLTTILLNEKGYGVKIAKPSLFIAELPNQVYQLVVPVNIYEKQGS